MERGGGNEIREAGGKAMDTKDNIFYWQIESLIRKVEPE